jgi:hypothetical protein
MSFLFLIDYDSLLPLQPAFHDVVVRAKAPTFHDVVASPMEVPDRIRVEINKDLPLFPLRLPCYNQMLP